MKKGILKAWARVVRQKGYVNWECPFRVCKHYDIVGSENSCWIREKCMPGRTGGQKCMMTWDEVPE
jgi:hypothetical protein